MALDPNIILQARGPQFDNPMDVYTKVMTMRRMAQQGQLQDQQISDQQSMRDAYKNNLVTDPTTGQTTLNRKGVTSDLYKSNPVQGLATEQGFAQTDRQTELQNLELITKKAAIAKNLAWSINDEASHNQARAEGLKGGLPDLGPYGGPEQTKALQMKTLSAEEQIGNMWKEKNFTQKEKELSLKRDELKKTKEDKTTEHQNKAVQETVQLIDAARQEPAAKQASLDIYNANKAKGLANLYGDPNKLSPQMMNLFVSEVSKVAKGGTPTIEEMKGLTPDVLNTKYANAVSKITSEPTPANIAGFVNQYADYMNLIDKEAKKTITDRYNRVLNVKKNSLGDYHYNNFKNEYVDRFAKEDEAAKKKETTEKPSWAK